MQKEREKAMRKEQAKTVIERKAAGADAAPAAAGDEPKQRTKTPSELVEQLPLAQKKLVRQKLLEKVCVFNEKFEMGPYKSAPSTPVE